MPFYDFKCDSCGSTFDERVSSAQRTHECPACGTTARRLIALPTIDPRLGIDPAFGTMADKWARTRVQRRKIETEKAREHGI